MTTNILENLEQKINCVCYNLELLGGFKNSRELIDAAKENMPDAIITAIVLPVLDRFQLTILLYKQNSQVKVIFISEYQKFEYTTNALKIYVFDYLTKPINSCKWFSSCLHGLYWASFISKKCVRRLLILFRNQE